MSTVERNAAQRARRSALEAGFFAGSAARVARRLLGCRLVSVAGGELTSGIIVETEAYLGVKDPASHARFGPTKRNQVMFGPAGVHYIYRSHGLHWCYDVVTGKEGVPSAVLIRALRPEEGLSIMRKRRGLHAADVALCRGPGNLARALGIEGWMDGAPAWTPPVWFEEGPGKVGRILVGPRIGVSGNEPTPLRFWIEDEPAVSARRRAHGTEKP